MSNYFDNQKNWAWSVSEGRVSVTTDHGSHTHTLDVTNITIGDMDEKTGQVMGDTHRAASHDPKEVNEPTVPTTDDATEVKEKTRESLSPEEAENTLVSDVDMVEEPNIQISSYPDESPNGVVEEGAEPDNSIALDYGLSL